MAEELTIPTAMLPKMDAAVESEVGDVQSDDDDDGDREPCSKPACHGKYWGATRNRKMMDATIGENRFWGFPRSTCMVEMQSRGRGDSARPPQNSN